MRKFNLRGKVSIVTGGAGLLGAQHALALAELKSKVILIDINRKKLLDQQKMMLKKNIKVNIFCADIRNEKKIKKICLNILKMHQKIDILINNATIDHKPNTKKKYSNKFENSSLDIWKKELEVGLTGAYICSKIFGNEMAKRKTGVILNIASDLSIIAPDQRLYSHLNLIKPASYSVIKHGIIGLTKFLASYWASKNIRVNALSPGGVFNHQDKEFLKK